MAVVTRLAVVLIVLPVPMLVIHLCLIVLVAQNALENFVVRRIHVARRTRLPFAAMLAGINAEVLAVVIERRRRPRIHGVASGAIVRKIQRHVIGVRRPLEIRLMAGEAIHRRAGKAIVHVALRASRRRVRAEQRKARFVMIESRRLPGARRVAARAGLRKIRRDVIRIRRALKIALMAGEAVRRRAGEAIVHVTQIACYGEMRAGERKLRAVVIEVRRQPGVNRMARQAIVRKIAGNVVRIRRSLKIRLVTGETIFRCAGKAIIDVALAASHRNVRALQWKSRRVVIERRWLPHAGGVAARASMRKICRRMIGIRRALKIGLMARETIRRCAGELIVRVALRTHHREMRAGERKLRAVVVEVRRLPGIERVAYLAIMRKIAGDMIWIRWPLKIRLVA
jgi:hypothetical protein